MTVGAKVSWGINFLAFALLLVSCSECRRPATKVTESITD